MLDSFLGTCLCHRKPVVYWCWLHSLVPVSVTVSQLFTVAIFIAWITLSDDDEWLLIQWRYLIRVYVDSFYFVKNVVSQCMTYMFLVPAVARVYRVPSASRCPADSSVRSTARRCDLCLFNLYAVDVQSAPAASNWDEPTKQSLINFLVNVSTPKIQRLVMPHGIFFHAASKSSNNYSLLYRTSTSSTLSCNILRCNHPLVLFSNFCASTKSVHCNSYSLRTTALLLLGEPPENSGTDYYARNQLLERNNTNYTQRTSPKVLAPNQGCPTIHRRSEGTNDSSGASSDLRSWCISRNFRAVTKSTLCKISLVKNSTLSHANHSSWNPDDDFTAENDFWLRIMLTAISAPHQRCNLIN